MAQVQRPAKVSLILGFVLVAIFGASGAAVIYINNAINPGNGTIAFEVAKAILQFGVVATVATAVSVLVFEYQRSRQNFDKDKETDRLASKERDANTARDLELAKETLLRKRDYRDELMKSVMTRAISSYNVVKKSRRMLRARGRYMTTVVTHGIPSDPKPMEVLDGKIYDREIETINDAQLELEVLSRDIEMSEDIFKHDSIKNNVDAMEKYLGELIKEYETKRKLFRKEDDSMELARLDEVAAFLARSEDNKQFKVKFAEPLGAMQRAIRRALSESVAEEPVVPAPAGGEINGPTAATDASPPR